ncbi:NAD-dependent succinate-semialdehyde dehydrogenase [uncultured Cytophaga sp.]|uniref:NAD-dependent succinate-semialdehyde dehydrogenase n=1 Tax=uncultured Cytophaga sp. TaxID=160238 RepID=UPI00262C5099|nr:NAD-dependent succinate-semialdehyde dehydrogenase [uncultured Cytophaga sp.]
MLQSTNPFTHISTVIGTSDTVEITRSKLTVSQKAFQDWKNTSLQERKTLFTSLSNTLRTHKQQAAEFITTEMGKPITESLSEIEKCIGLVDWYVEHCETFLEPSPRQELSPKKSYSYIRFEPLGTILGIMPWNFPFWQVFRFAIPTILAGNCVILKHASNVQGCAKFMERHFELAGFTSGVFIHSSASSKDIETLISSPIIQGVSLTGSEGAGRSVAALAGKHLKKCVFELGGSDPFIVLSDADLDTCIPLAIKGRLINNGQSCIASKRFIIHEGCYAPFMEGLAKAVSELIIGDPMQEKTNLGTMASAEFKTELLKQVDQSIEEGATVYFKHPFDDSNSNFIAPIILENIPHTAPARRDELFGPVFSCIKVSSTEEAIRIANETAFGLGASIWTKDIAKAQQLAVQIESGSVFINEMVHSDVRIPFGGIKNSGYGRELAIYGMHAFVNIKTVVVNE